MECIIIGCQNEAHTGALCSRHYMRFRRTGTYDDGPRARNGFTQRLWSKIDVREPDVCWPWTAKENIDGYGKLGRGGRGAGSILAHRAVWEEFNGPIPPHPEEYHGYVVMHECDNRQCCNPAHLKLGTQKENVRDMDAKGRRVNAGPYGEAHHKAKLTEKDVREIRASSESQYALARKYGVTRPMIGYIKRGQSWKHVT